MGAKHSYFDAYKLMFIHDESRPSLNQFAVNQKIDNIPAFVRYAKQHDWEYHRDKYWAEHAQVVAEQMMALQVNDSTRKLREIQAMKAKAWQSALSTEFKTADKAISSYSELEKLERLILGQSTENITVSDLQSYMLAVVRIMKEEVEDVATLDRIRVRMEGLTLANAAQLAEGHDLGMN